MTEFDKLDLMVAPIEDSKVKRPNLWSKTQKKYIPIPWSDPKWWCSWQERETTFPGVKDWYVIPAARKTYDYGGVEIGYWVLDVDNHEGDRFEEACEFLRSCNLPKSLTIRTPSGGIHKYYKCLAECVPKAVKGVTINGKTLPIEIKSNVGVVAPNGRDRVVIDDSPVAMLMPQGNTLFSKIAKLKPKRTPITKKETDPDFPIEKKEFPDVGSGERHDTLMSTACSLYARGCPPEKIQWWGKEFYKRTNRKEQPNEISNIVRDAMKYVDGEIDELLMGAETPPHDPRVPNTIARIFPGCEIWEPK